MRLARHTVLGAVAFIGCVLVFIFAGALWGWRIVGVVSLFGAIGALRERRVGVGIEGYEPSFYLTGRAATVAALLGVLISLFFILFAQTVVEISK